MKQARPQPTVRAVERTLNILFLIATASEPLTLSYISSSTGVDKATALRLLATLEQFRLVQKDEKSRTYAIGAGAWQLASSYQSGLKSMSETHLRILRDQTSESVSLIVARGLERVMLTALEASHELRVVPSLNSVVPVYSGASGKVFMAFMSPSKRDSIIELTGLKPVNERCVTDRDSFLASLEQVQRDGYAVSVGDVTIGAVAVAAPIFDAQGEVVAVVSLRGPEARLTSERVHQLAPLVKEAARNIAADVTGPDRKVGDKVG